MRYIKYSGDWPDPDGIRQRSRELHAKAQRQHRRKRWMGRLSSAAFFLVFLLVFVGLMILIWGYSTEDPILGILETALDIVLTFVALILSFVGGALGATPFTTKADKEKKRSQQKLFSETCSMLRTFYQLQEPFLVTKCYQSSDRKFGRHDVCIFVVGEELRITTNLQHGFLDPKRDLGCYCLTRQELHLSDARFKDRPALSLQADNLSFLLGSKAGPFIKKHFLTPET